MQVLEFYRSLEMEECERQNIAKERRKSVAQNTEQGPQNIHASGRAKRMVEAAKQLEVVEIQLNHAQKGLDVNAKQAEMEDLKMGNARKRVCLDRVS